MSCGDLPQIPFVRHRLHQSNLAPVTKAAGNTGREFGEVFNYEILSFGNIPEVDSDASNLESAKTIVDEQTTSIDGSTANFCWHHVHRWNVVGDGTAMPGTGLERHRLNVLADPHHSGRFGHQQYSGDDDYDDLDLAGLDLRLIRANVRLHDLVPDRHGSEHGHNFAEQRYGYAERRIDERHQCLHRLRRDRRNADQLVYRIASLRKQ